MASFAPLQESFNAGAISPRLHGHFSSSLYKRGLFSCKNLIPTPHGSLLLRAGTKDLGLFAGALRLAPFNKSNGSPFSVMLKNATAEIYDLAGTKQTFPAPGADVVTNGRFEVNTNGWTLSNTERKAGGYVGPTAACAADPFASMSISQAVALTAGVAYKLRFKRWYGTASTGVFTIRAGGGGILYTEEFEVPTAPGVFEVDFVAPAGAATIFFAAKDVGLGVYVKFNIDDISIINTATPTVDSFATPWATALIAAVQYDQDLAKNRMMFVHRNAIPKLLTLDTSLIWRLEDAPFEAPPSSWSGANYPACIEWGYQGRLWLGGEPVQPNLFVASKSGEPLNFTIGVNAADAMSWNASVRGAIRWLRGQVSFLLGSEQAEQAANANGSLIAPTNPPDLRDESVFGSGDIQAVSIGDEVLYVGKDYRTLRAMSFDALTKNGWVSNPISFIGEHLFKVKTVKEIHFVTSPDPIVFVIFTDGDMVACTYKKDPQAPVIAWFGVDVGANVLSGCVLETSNGSVLRLLVEREDGTHMEDLQMYETGADYLDSWASVAASAEGVVSGLARFEGLTVTVKYQDDEGHVVLGSGIVAGGSVTIEDAAGQTVAVGLGFLGEAVTLPLPLRDKKGRYAKIGVLLNDSALPKLNGWTPQNDKLGDDPLSLPQTLRSGKFTAGNEGTDDEAKITITQDLPFRTEILALFGVAEV